MKVKENRKSLSEEESARLGNLIWKHRNLICKVIANRLNKHTYYLLEDCEAEVLALASEAGADLLYHPTLLDGLCLQQKMWFIMFCEKNERRVT